LVDITAFFDVLPLMRLPGWNYLRR